MYKVEGFNWIWMVLCLAALAIFSGCQSGSPLDLNDEAQINVSETSGDVDLIGDAWSAAVLDEPVLPKGPSDLSLLPGINPQLDPGLFLAMHIPLDEGENSVPVEDYMAASDNVSEMFLPGGLGWYTNKDGELVYGPITHSYVTLSSGPAELSYITYGFSGIPEGKEIIGLKIYGSSEAELFNPGQGLYVGIGDYGRETWRWYGGLGTQDYYELDFRNLDTTNSGQCGYLTLAVYGGDTYTISSVHVIVGNKIPPLLVGEVTLQTIF
jgi:hypothetical protein